MPRPIPVIRLAYSLAKSQVRNPLLYISLKKNIVDCLESVKSDPVNKGYKCGFLTEIFYSILPSFQIFVRISKGHFRVNV